MDDQSDIIEKLHEEIESLRWEIVGMGWNFMEFAKTDKILFGRNQNGEVAKMWWATGYDDETGEATEFVWMTDLGIFEPVYFMPIPENLPEKHKLINMSN